MKALFSQVTRAILQFLSHVIIFRGADKSLARPGRKQANVSVRMAGKKKKNLTTARVSMLLKSRASLTFFRACFLPGWAKDLSAPDIRLMMAREWAEISYLGSLCCVRRDAG